MQEPGDCGIAGVVDGALIYFSSCERVCWNWQTVSNAQLNQVRYFDDLCRLMALASDKTMVFEWSLQL